MKTTKDAKKIAFITCVNHEEWYSECRLYLEHLRLPDGMTAEYIPVRGAASMCAGYNAGAKTVCVLSGECTQADVDASDFAPTLVLPSVKELIPLIR